MNLDRIRIDVGVGDLIFGMTVSQVESLLGTCTSRRTLDEGDVELSFADHGITCEFSKEWKGLLTAIGSKRENANILGKGLHGMSKSDVLKMHDVLGGDISRTGRACSDENIEIIETDGLVRIQHWFRSDRHYEVWNILRFIDDKPFWPMPQEDYTPDEEDGVWPDELWDIN